MSQANAEFSQETLNDLSDYFYGAPIGLKITAPDGTITRTNLAEIKMLGYDDNSEEYVGHHIAEFHSDPDGVQDLLERVVHGERVAEYETTLLRRDGTPQKVLMYANAKIEDGEFRGMRCFTFPHPEDLRHDIAEAGALTDQSVESRGLDLAPSEKREMYAELRDFFDHSPVNLHIVGGDGLIKQASQSELAAMGYDREAYVGQHIARFHADQRVIDGMLEDLVGGTPLVNFSATLFHKDGSKIPVMIYSNSRMRDGSFVNTRCFTVSVPKARQGLADNAAEFAWPRNEDFGFTIPGKTTAPAKPNPMTLALKYIASRKRPEESLGFLAKVSQVLTSQQTFDAMIAEVTALGVPFLADFISVDTTDRHLGHASTTTLRKRLDAVVRAIREGGADEKFSVASVRKATEAQVGVDLRAHGDGATKPGKQLLDLGFRSVMMMPLAIRGTQVGAVTLLREDAQSRRIFGLADRALAEELARRISLSLEIEQLSNRA